MSGSISPPWYKHPYVWMLIAIPSCAVIMGMTTLALAISSYDGLVIDDYYQQGLEINRVKERDQRAHSLQLSMSAYLSRTKLKIELKSGLNAPLPETIHVKLSHSTRSGFDQDLALVRGLDGTYSMNIQEMVPGAWYVQVGAADWRVVQRTLVR